MLDELSAIALAAGLTAAPPVPPVGPIKEAPPLVEWSQGQDGGRADPVTLYVHGTLAELRASFRRGGWTEARPKTPLNDARFAAALPFEAAHRLADRAWRSAGGRALPNPVRPIIQAASVTPQTWEGRPMAAAFEKDNDPFKSRHHFRVFDTGRKDRLGRTVWALAATHDIDVVLAPRSLSSGLLTHKADPVVDAERDEVLRGLLAGGSVESLERWVAAWPSGSAFTSRDRLVYRAVLASGGADERPLLHSHNDYRRARPLEDALALGFDSVEADVFLVDGRLLVAHKAEELDPGRTLERLYLEPLRRLAEERAGRPLVLLVDLKSEANAAARALDEALARYEGLLGPVSVLASGSASSGLTGPPPRRFALDANRLGTGASAGLAPWISLEWSKTMRWDGLLPIPAAERRHLRELARRAREEGRRLRLWKAPDRERVWTELCAAGVGVLHTDRLSSLKRFVDEGRCRRGPR